METQLEKIGAKGIYHFTLADLETSEHFALDAKISALRKAGKYDEALPLIRELNSSCKVKKFTVENIVPTVGRTMIANNLTNASPTNVMKITHCALGSSSTAVANTDTQLGTETYRNAISSITNANNIGYVTGFFSTTETNGTYAEVGIFSNGTGTVNTGVLFSHVLASITKTNVQTLTLDWTITFS